jgi:DNA-binding response OmpR family regulator
MSQERIKKILVAEDEKPMAKTMNIKLTRAGFEVTIASNGEEVLLLLDENTYDLIITDLMMPKVDGFKILTEIKKRGLTVPVIVTSNLSQEEDEKKAKDLGAINYFVKSNTPIIQIVDYVNEILKNEVTK